MVNLDDAKSLTGRLYRELAGRRPQVRKFDRYFRGDQPLAYASPEWREFHDRRFDRFADNWCGVVASSPAERLRCNGIRLGSDTDVISGDERLLARDWDVNDLDAQSSQGFLESVIAKRSFALVWWSGNDDEPVEITWEHPDDMIVAYRPGSRRHRVAALKTWVEEDVELATLYTPDGIWKWSRPWPARTSGGQANGYAPGAEGFFGRNPGREPDAANPWQPREIAGESWPLPNPLGSVPVVEFPNRPMLGGEPLSDIEGTIAMQDAVNLLWAYLFGAADFASLPARVVMGQDPPKVPVLDSGGQMVGEQPVDQETLRHGRMLWLTGQNTTIGKWDPANLDTFTNVINRCVRHVAAQTRTPLHYIVGEMNNVNGDTLVALETGLVKKVEEAQLFMGPALREMFRLAALVRGDTALASAVRSGRILWADPQTRTQAQASDAAIKDRQVGLPLAWVAERRYGLTPDEVARMLALRDAEAGSLLTGDLGVAFAVKPPVAG